MNQIHTTIGEIAAADFRKVHILNKYGIDFCCGGKKTLQQACQEKGLEVNKMISEMELQQPLNSGSINHFIEWDLGFLLQYILVNHHCYLKRELPEINRLLTRVVVVHGANHSELSSMARYFAALKAELEMHMHKEEEILFPFITELLAAREEGKPMEAFHCGHIAQPIAVMEMEHESAGANLKKIRESSADFAVPEDACNTYRLTLVKLEELETDLHQHIHLENNILFPKAIELEQSVC